MINDTETLIYENDRITDGFDIFFWIFNDSSSFVATHWHQAIEIMYIIEGEVDVTLNGTEKRLLPGDLFLIDSSVIHSTKSINGNHAILIQLPYRLLKQYIPDFNSLNFSFDCHTKDADTQEKISGLVKIIKEMQIIFETGPKGGILKFNSLVFELMYQLYHNFSTPILATDIRMDEKHFERLKLVMEYTNNHYNSPITLDEIADIACFQKEYFCHFFKKNMNKTYFEFLNEVRLSHIYYDLINTDLTLKEILAAHGFTNYKLFRHIFFSQFKMTPGEYRTLYKNSRVLKSSS